MIVILYLLPDVVDGLLHVAMVNDHSEALELLQRLPEASWAIVVDRHVDPSISWSDGTTWNCVNKAVCLANELDQRHVTTYHILSRSVDQIMTVSGQRLTLPHLFTIDLRSI